MPQIFRVSSRLLLLFVAALPSGLTVAVRAPVPIPSRAVEAQRAATLSRITKLRDDFVMRVHGEGLSCPIPPPGMAVEFTPSFGDYDEVGNRVVTSDWTMLPPAQKSFFFQLAGQDPTQADDAAAHGIFEDTMHRWMLVHELAHWWQTCERGKVMTGAAPFAIGVEADRITLAYWRATDPEFPARIAAIVQGLIDHAPSPVPAGQQLETYFNQKYGTLGPAMPWFAAHMVLTAYAERPEPNMAQALALGRK